MNGGLGDEITFGPPGGVPAWGPSVGVLLADLPGTNTGASTRNLRLEDVAVVLLRGLDPFSESLEAGASGGVDPVLPFSGGVDPVLPFSGGVVPVLPFSGGVDPVLPFSAFSLWDMAISPEACKATVTILGMVGVKIW